MARVKDWGYPEICCQDEARGYSQRRNRSDMARSHEELASDHISTPPLNSGCAFTEALADFDDTILIPRLYF